MVFLIRSGKPEARLFFNVARVRTLENVQTVQSIENILRKASQFAISYVCDVKTAQKSLISLQKILP